MELWNIPAINCIGHAVGSPLQVDPSSLARNHPNGPRFQVLINAMDEPFEEIEIEMHNGNWIKQKIVFEFLPRICSKCGMLGHSLKMCNENGDRDVQFQSGHSYKATLENPARGPPPWNGNRTQGPPPHRNGWVRNHYPQNESHMRIPTPRNVSRPRGPPPRGFSRPRDPPVQSNIAPTENHQRDGRQQTSVPPTFANKRNISRGRSRTGRNSPRNRSKSAPKRKGKTPVGARRSLSRNGAGRQQVWQEKTKEPPATSFAPNTHIRFGSPSHSPSISNLPSAGLPGDQALRLQYPDGVENGENAYDGEVHDDCSSDDDLGRDLNTIIPDSLVDENVGICAETDPCTPTSSKPCEVPLSPSPISLSVDSNDMTGREIAVNDGRMVDINAMAAKLIETLPKTIENGANIRTMTKENNNKRNTQATHKPKNGSNKKGKRGKHGWK